MSGFEIINVGKGYEVRYFTWREGEEGEWDKETLCLALFFHFRQALAFVESNPNVYGKYS
jgi:hypothetical protein